MSIDPFAFLFLVTAPSSTSHPEFTPTHHPLFSSVLFLLHSLQMRRGMSSSEFGASEGAEENTTSVGRLERCVLCQPPLLTPQLQPPCLL